MLSVVPSPAPSATPRRLLLVKLSSLGDIAHALPLADALRAGLPQTHIAWAVKAKFADVLVGNPNVDALHILPDSKPATLWRFGNTLRGGERFDVALDAQGLLVSGLVARLSGAATRIGFDGNREQNARFLTHAIVPSTQRAHMVEKLMGFCDALSLPKTTIRSQTYLACAESARADEMLAPFAQSAPIVGCIIGASRADKTWPRERWIKLAGALADQGFMPLLLGGKAEEALASDIAQTAPSSVVNLVGQTPLRVLSAVLARCAVVVGGDSGPLHLAVAVGAPVVGLYGVTDPVRSGPHWSIGPSATMDLAEADAPAATRRTRHTTLPDAMSRIPATAVLDQVINLAARRNLLAHGGVR